MLSPGTHTKNAKPSRKAAEVAALLLDTVPQVMKELRREAKPSPGSLTLPQFRILAQIYCEESTNNKSLAEAVGVSVAATSRMLDLLEKKGFVEKVPGKTDKREIQLRLTKKGNQHFESVRKAIQARLRDRFARLPENELKAVETGLAALASAFAKIYPLPH